MRSNETVPGFKHVMLRTQMQALRLVGLSALLGLLAGPGVSAYAATPEETPSPAAAPSAMQGDAPANPSPQTAPMLSAQSDTAATVKGKKDKKKKKEKPPKLTPVHIEQGTLTVDGWTGKARLNYDIADLKYIYVWAPGIGTVVASNQKFPLGKEEPGAFNGNTLTMEAGGHIIQLSSEKKLLKDKKPSPAYVFLDTSYKANTAFPEMGYGSAKDAPYAWPGAKDAPVNKGVNIAAPPLPAGMRPVLAVPACKPAAVPTSPPAPGAMPTGAGCPAPATSPSTTAPSGPAAAPSVLLPGYSTGTTTAKAGHPAATEPLP